MADPQSLIPPGAGDPATAAAPGAPPPGAAAAGPGDAIAQNPASLIPADAQGQAVDGADQGGPRAKGTQQDVYDAAVDNNPEAEVPATPQEQAQYHSLVARFILFISDPRQASAKHASPTQSVLAMLNAPKVPAAIAIGRTAAKVVMTLLHTAKAQGKPYDAEVVFHAADEIIPALYLMGAAHGIWHGLPPFHGLAQDGSYDFADDEIKVLGEAKMQGIHFIGNMMVQAGWITPDVAKANADLWKQQIEREVQAGAVSDEVLEQIAQSGQFNKIYDQLGAPSGTSTAPAAGQPGSSGGTPDSFPADAADNASTPAPADSGTPPSLIPAGATP